MSTYDRARTDARASASVQQLVRSGSPTPSGYHSGLMPSRPSATAVSPSWPVLGWQDTHHRRSHRRLRYVFLPQFQLPQFLALHVLILIFFLVVTSGRHLFVRILVAGAIDREDAPLGVLDVM
eukprot:CAMPEP_0117660416 /NCGR_PEP_ID=MMETSP0804-20121206/6956_1 /TAXON_ID=1074897 /ORGANISM="Tetraselmis astigmatica, Strain CCMP880" /LENGTH=122 /DNA_ID=CAMNT_0005467143 /DNA_START=494 /DNA_END=863 /DNA_ORIENTATION=+